MAVPPLRESEEQQHLTLQLVPPPFVVDRSFGSLRLIYTPRGDSIDATRPPAFYDGTAAFLSECGLSFL
jgi:hypothetical protein